jgi:hypothetical protein
LFLQDSQDLQEQKKMGCEAQGSHATQRELVDPSQTNSLRYEENLFDGLLQQRDEILNVTLGGIKRRHESDFRSFLVPHVEEVLFLKHRNIFLWQLSKHTV